MERVEVHVTGGQVRGERRGDVLLFQGVPYAAVPTGPLRFAPPEPHGGWTDTFDARAPGPNAPQFIRPFPGLDVEPLIGAGWSRGDDFLNVNVWTPDRRESDAPCPVMVFIHGGAWVLGSNAAKVQDGSAFARSGVVCISINYRLGVEGFLAIPGAPTNLGLRDQIAALQWVQANAAAFGGDPGQVTVFGESAGAMSIACLVASPLAKGLFRRAIIQSGHGGMVRPIEVSRRLARRVARLLKTPCTLAGFRNCSADACVAALETVSQPATLINMRDAQGFDPAFGLSRFLPVYGDDVLPVRPIEALAAGAGSEVDIMVGTNREEMNLYFVPTGVKAAITPIMASLALRRSMPKASAVLKAYGMGAKARSSGEAFTAAASDLVFRWPARRFAEAHQGRAHMYEFDWRSSACGGELGACHGVELPFVFKTLAVCRGPEGLVGASPPEELADRTHALWVEFARGARPAWPPYDSATRHVYAITAGTSAYEPPAPAATFLP